MLSESIYEIRWPARLSACPQGHSWSWHTAKGPNYGTIAKGLVIRHTSHRCMTFMASPHSSAIRPSQWAAERQAHRTVPHGDAVSLYVSVSRPCMPSCNVMTQKAWWAFKELIHTSAYLPELYNILYNAPDGSADLYAECRVHLKCLGLNMGRRPKAGMAEWLTKADTKLCLRYGSSICRHIAAHWPTGRAQKHSAPLSITRASPMPAADALISWRTEACTAKSDSAVATLLRA